MKPDWLDRWGVVEHDTWSDPVVGIKVFSEDLIGDKLSPGARMLNLWLRFVACHERLSECSRERLASDLDVSPATITRWLKELGEAGKLEPFAETWLTNPDEGQVYFIQAEGGGPIKIGKAVDPWQRLSQLQTGYHEPLKILAVMPGGLHAEKELHQKFAAYRVKGEWFLASDEILEFIRRL